MKNSGKIFVVGLASYIIIYGISEKYKISKEIE